MSAVRLGAILDATGIPALASQGAVLAARGADPDIASVVHDSRRVERGSLFCCVPGGRHDGHRFAADAARDGAVALVCERPLGIVAAEVVVPDVRAVMGPIASAFHRHPSRSLHVVGVTGTNGKTTTVHLLAQLLAAGGRPCEVIGTLTGARTTPEGPELQAALRAALDAGRGAVAMEVSSHALAQHRVDGTRFAAAVFTNLSPEHLDYHGTMEEYFRAKARLFDPMFTDLAVIDADGPYGRLLADAAPVERVVVSGESTVEVLRVGLDGSTFRWRGRVVHLPLVGRFNIANAVLAADTAAALGVDEAQVAHTLGRVEAVPGRFERVATPLAATVVVDYAHTPDGLARVLDAAREVAGSGAVTVVFGCGGDRDRAKRPLMGAEAERRADRVVVTSDNPRHERPEAIIEEVLAGMARRPDVVEPDRRAAVRAALELAAPGDIVVVAGKGHETTQQIGDATFPFDDRVVVREEAEAVRASRGGSAK